MRGPPCGARYGSTSPFTPGIGESLAESLSRIGRPPIATPFRNEEVRSRLLPDLDDVAVDRRRIHTGRYMRNV
jgi:hypothetical protein